MTYRSLGLGAFVGLALAAPASAHHSFAMFDQSKTLTYRGTVKEFEWGNPRVWVRVTMTD